MKSRSAIRNAVTAVVVGVLLLTSVLGSAAFADTPRVSEIVVTKVSDTSSPSYDRHELESINLTYQRIDY